MNDSESILCFLGATIHSLSDGYQFCTSAVVNLYYSEIDSYSLSCSCGAGMWLKTQTLVTIKQSSYGIWSGLTRHQRFWYVTAESV